MKNTITALFLLITSLTVYCATTPQIGDFAPNFKLETLDGKSVELKQLVTKQTVVLVVLRGWPGYQCPMCTRQVHDFVEHADQLATQHARVLMVYPGPGESLKAHAQDFLQDKHWPKDFLLVIDPDYSVTERYGLRWKAKNETAYPSTFVVSKKGKVKFAQVSKTHGGRAPASAVLESIKALNE